MSCTQKRLRRLFLLLVISIFLHSIFVESNFLLTFDLYLANWDTSFHDYLPPPLGRLRSLSLAEDSVKESQYFRAENGIGQSSSLSSASKIRFTYTEKVKHAIFFNIYIPETREGEENALRIVKEQIGQIKDSYAYSGPISNGTIVVYYVTLGQENVLTPELMGQFCGSLRCVHVDHFKEGSEAVTLQHSYQFCSSPAQERARITYLHNKGSFHNNEVNENWRHILTEAALSEMCIKESECNLCGLQFFTQWAPFIPGNIFTAKCNYVKKLIPPVNFSDAMQRAIEDFVVLRLKKQVLSQLLPDRKDFFGLERYSDEHWIASHPDVTPCDCDPTGQLSIYHMEKATLANLSWAMAPRHKGAPAYNKQARTEMVNKNKVLRVVEYYYLAGNLVKWFSLYGKGPAPNSWAYKFFPDGEMWKDAVQKYGAQAVDKITQKFASEIIIPEDLPFPENPTESKLAMKAQVRDVLTRNSSFAVFFDIGVRADFADETANSELKFVKEQLDIISSSKLISNVFYLTMGHNVTTKTKLCDQMKGLHCEHLKHSEKMYSGETIRHIYQYCKHNPNRKIVYLRNQLPGRIKTIRRRRRLLRHLTMAVTSDSCVKALVDNQCNLCGLKFFTLHTPHMLGNMWASSCSHINQLLPPEEFVGKLGNFRTKVLIQKIWTRINFGLLEETPDTLGLGGNAMEHWVGSRPELLPCDLTDEPVSFWMKKPRNQESLRLFYGPHSMDAPYVSINRDKESQLMSTDRLRMREFYYLPGNLLKWLTLYERVPPDPSWAWTFFPDGKLWLDGFKKYGKDVVQHITSQYEFSEVEIDTQWAKEESAAEAKAARAVNRAHKASASKAATVKATAARQDVSKET